MQECYKVPEWLNIVLTDDDKSIRVEHWVHSVIHVTSDGTWLFW